MTTVIDRGFLRNNKTHPSVQFRIQIRKNGEEVDLNYLPNIHTKSWNDE